MPNEFAFDEREWMREELAIAADEWLEIVAGCEQAQAMDIRNMLMDLAPLRTNNRLSDRDRLAVARVMDQLVMQLRALRR